MKEDIGARSARVTHLEHVLRARDREFSRLKEERDAGRAAERERARVGAVLCCVYIALHIVLYALLYMGSTLKWRWEVLWKAC